MERRERVGDWEADTILGKGHQGAVVTLVERKSRFLRMGLVNNRPKDSVKETMKRLSDGYPVHTITSDNGKELAAHDEVAEVLNAAVDFAHPNASRETQRVLRESNQQEHEWSDPPIYTEGDNFSRNCPLKTSALLKTVKISDLENSLYSTYPNYS